MQSDFFLFGAGDFCKEAILSGVFSECSVRGIFDSNEERVGDFFYGYEIVPLYFDKSITVCVTNVYRVECVRILLKIGYKKFDVVYNRGSEFLIKHYDYSRYDVFNEKKNKVLLMGRNLSGSNIYGLNRLSQNVMNAGIEVKYICGDQSDDLFYHILTSKVIVVEYDKQFFPQDKIVVQLWHGFGPKTSGLRNKLLRDENTITRMLSKWKGYSVICSYSDTYSTIIGSCYGVPSYKFSVTGMPRNDVLLTSFHSFCEIFPECKGMKVVLYMPTFRQRPMGDSAGDESGYIFNNEGFDFNSFNEECRKRDIFFIIKYHVFDSDKETYNRTNVRFLTEDMIDIDFYEYLGNSDLLITDYSSVFTDYLLLNKPILFFGNDLVKYDDDRGFLLEPIEKWLPGPIVTDTDNLFDEIERLLNDENYYKKKRELVKCISHRFYDAESGKRVWEKILGLVNSADK